jgi:hypothetical protein
LDELGNALDSLEMCRHFLDDLPDPYRWKWATIALHNAIYGFAVCAVRGTDSRSVLEPPNKRGERRLIHVWEALRRAQDQTFVRPTATPLTLSDDEQSALERVFGEFRDEFSHFQPKGWSIQVLAMVEVFRPAIAVLRRLALEQDMVLYYDESDRTRAAAALDRLDQCIVACGSG